MQTTREQTQPGDQTATSAHASGKKTKQSRESSQRDLDSPKKVGNSNENKKRSIFASPEVIQSVTPDSFSQHLMTEQGANVKMDNWIDQDVQMMTKMTAMVRLLLLK